MRILSDTDTEPAGIISRRDDLSSYYFYATDIVYVPFNFRTSSTPFSTVVFGDGSSYDPTQLTFNASAW